ncbi:MAG: PhoU family transcriptional regulator [Campylobacterota bacterium]|nr:PhoU family transcriptional regulator [Campylobacterota bacterium]
MLSNFKDDLVNVKNEVKETGIGLVKANELLLEGIKDCNKEKFNEAKSYIKNVSKKSSDIDNEAIRILALYNPEAKDLRQVVSYFKITNELLRATTNTRSFIKGFMDVCNDIDIKTVNEYAIPMQTSTIRAVNAAISMIDIECEDEMKETYNEVLIEESKNDDLYEMVEKSLFKQADESDNFQKFHNMLKALRKSEKVADRAISIAGLFLYSKVGGNI